MPDSQPLASKRAIVTGSNSGIGLGIAHALARAGAAVVLNSFTDREEDHDLADTLAKQYGVDARYISADMSDPGDCRALIERAGGCDILVNNAGIQHVARIEEFPPENGMRCWRSTCRRPFTPWLRPCRECARAAGGGWSISLRPTG